MHQSTVKVRWSCLMSDLVIILQFKFKVGGKYAYSVDSIKHTVLLKVLLQIFLLLSIKSTAL